MNKKLKLADLGRLSVEEFKEKEHFPITVVLDDIRSLNNVGSIFRTCDALAISKLYLCGITPKPPHREIQKTALGSTQSVDWEYKNDILALIDDLKNQGKKVFIVEQTAESMKLNEIHFDRDIHYVLVMGNEVKGVKQEIVDIADSCIEIPQFGTKHSFNVSVCTGIVLWDVVKSII